MNILVNKNLEFSYAGLFISKGQWCHPTRIEKTYEIIYVTEGEVHMREGENEFILKKGESVILSPYVSHMGTKTTKDVKFYWVHFYLRDDLPFKKRLFDRFDNPHLFKELLHTNNLPQPPAYLINAILCHILCEYFRMSECTVTEYNATAEKIYEWIRINANGILKVEDVAKQFGFSSDYISRLIKKNYGIGARELINKFVLSRAKDMLCNTDMYIKEIAYNLCFTSDKSFISYFKYHEGCFPSKFRKKYGKLHMNNK